MKRISTIISPLVGIGILSICLWILSKELSSFHFNDVVARITSISEKKVWISFGLCFLSYVVLTSYDFLGLVYAKVKLSYGKIALSSFVAYSLSHNLGFALVTGGAARLRMLTRWEVSASDVAKQVGFVSMMFSLGFCSIAGISFVSDPPSSEYISGSAVFATGVILLSFVAIFFTFLVSLKDSVTILGISLPRVPIPLTLAAVTIAAVDWAIAALVAWVLFPTGSISYFDFLGIFLIAQVVGLISHVPGGIGVFEGVMVSALAGKLPADKVLGCLLVFRFIYYIIPFILALLTYAFFEAYNQRFKVKQVAKLIARPSAVMMPAFTCVTIFGSGVVLLISGATPPVRYRLKFLLDWLPIQVIETFHVIGSLLGVCLLMVAHGLWRRVDRAYYGTIVLLLLAILSTILKGFDLEEAAILSFVFLLFLPTKTFFFRKTTLWEEPLSPRWTFLVVSTLIGVLWVLFFFYKHVEYSEELWWQFASNSYASRSMRATLIAILFAAFWIGLKFLAPAARPFLKPTEAEMAEVKQLLKNSSSTNATLALTGDKQILFNLERTGFVMFADHGRSFVAMGDPIGSPEVQEELIWDFFELCKQHGKHCCFYEISEQNLGTFVEVGLVLLKLGEEAHVDLQSFTIEGKARASLRSCRNKLIKDGLIFSIVEGPQSDQAMAQYKFVSDSWLSSKNTKEKGFSLGFFADGYIRQFPIATLTRDGQIIAFANIWRSEDRTELSVDLMRYVPDAPNGLMDYLFTELFLWGKEQGYQRFNLGMAPLSGLEDRQFAPFWNKLGAMLFHHGEHFYNFKGLRTYKEKFDPVWKSRYLAFPSRFSLPLVLSNIASLVSGGMRGLFVR